MKNIVTFAVTAALVAGASADVSHQHQHMHRHRQARKLAEREQASPVEKRDSVSVVWDNPVETAYVFSNGEVVGAEEAQKCIEDGSCIVVGQSTPSTVAAQPSATSTSTSTTPATTSSTKQAAEFFENKAANAATTLVTSSSSTVSTTSTTPVPTTTSTSAKAVVTTSSSKAAAATTSSAAAAATSASSSSSSGSTDSSAGTSKTFPNGEIPCSTFPSEYGAVALDWVGLDGWASIQETGSWTPGESISSIVQPTSGGCVKGSFCSYACSAGQTKAQWPTTSQGSTGQSIGGLWCNSDGYLERTNDNFETLCMEGLGGIYIKNELSKSSSVCGTNYPGNEMMNIALVTEPGNTYTLTNIDAKKAYQWEGKYTSGQFYVNNAGVSVEESCVWDSSSYPTSAGNWAPVNIGAGTDIYGVTYISIFANSPTTTAELDFDIIISGDITEDCYLKSGSYYGGGTGCTTALTSSSGTATITFKASS